MERSGHAINVAVAAIIVALAMAGAAGADDVIIKTITPDKPPAVKPEPAPLTAPDLEMPAIKVGNPDDRPTGDWVFDRSVQELHLSADEINKVRPILEDFRVRTEADRKELFERIRPNQTRRTALYAQIKRDESGRIVRPAELDQLEKEYGKISREFAQKNITLRDQMIADVGAVLGGERGARLRMLVNAGGPDAIRGRQQARELAVKAMFPGVDFDADKIKRALEIYDLTLAPYLRLAAESQDKSAALRAKADDGDTEARKALEEAFGKVTDARAEAVAAAREAIGKELLTAEQRQVAEAGRQEQIVDATKYVTNLHKARYAKAGLTEDQTKRVNELINAAGDTMIKTGRVGLTADPTLIWKMQKDIESLLTDEQKKKLGP